VDGGVGGVGVGGGWVGGGGREGEAAGEPFDDISWTGLVSASKWCTHVSLPVTVEIPHLRSQSMTKVVGKFQLMKLHRSSLLCVSHKSAFPQFTILNTFWLSDAQCSHPNSQHHQQPAFINEFQLERLLW